MKMVALACRGRPGGSLGAKVGAKTGQPVISRTRSPGQSVAGRAGVRASASLRTVFRKLLVGGKEREGEEVAANENEVKANAPEPMAEEHAAGVPKRRVGIVGANGQLGSRIAGEMSSAGWDVTALTRSSKDRVEALEEGVRVVEGFDTTDVDDEGVLRMASELRGLDCIVIVPSSSRSEYERDGFTPFSNELEGVRNVLRGLDEAGLTATNSSRRGPTRKLVDFGFSSCSHNPAGGAKVAFRPLDDTLMGGLSSSSAFYAGDCLCWTGEVKFEGGGFCGIRSEDLAERTCAMKDAETYDGIELRVQGDGQTYKIGVRTEDLRERPGCSFQASFVAPEGVDFATVRIPFEDFVFVDQTRCVPDPPPLLASKIISLGFVLSRYSYNRSTNTNCRPGKFLFRASGAITLYRERRAQVVLVSSAACERNQMISSEEERMADIPIVQLNPKSVLNAKYAGECAVRNSGYDYVVVRPVGLKDREGEGEVFVTEVSQGDTLAGTISRDEVARAVAEAAAVRHRGGVTFEVASRESPNKRVDPAAVLRRQLRSLQPDHRRPALGIPPFPKPDCN